MPLPSSSLSLPSILLLLLLPPLLTHSTTTIPIKVGSGGLNFDPDTVTASKGDILLFTFYSPEHSVAESSFHNPCQPGGTNIFSGLVSTKEGKNSEVFSLPINTTDPIWLYCSYETHCNDGMAMVVNPPTSTTDTLPAYISAAESASIAQPSAVSGGVFIAASAVSAAPPSSSSPSSGSGSSSSSGSTSPSGSSSSSGSASQTSGSATAGGSGTATTAGPSGGTTTGAAAKNAGGRVGVVGMGMGFGGVVGGLVGGVVAVVVMWVIV